VEGTVASAAVAADLGVAVAGGDIAAVVVADVVCMYYNTVYAGQTDL
jgi:hypothetical protein